MAFRVLTLAALLVPSLALAGTGLAQSSLSLRLTVDDTFQAWVSTSPTATVGSPVASGASWTSVINATTPLAPGSDLWLHVRGVDNANPAMFIGSFSITGTEFLFGNGLNSLVTNPSNWVVSRTAFGVDTFTPVDLGGPASGPWGGSVGAQFPTDARYLWTQSAGGGEAYFSTRLTFIPGPGSLGVLAISSLLAARRRR